ncbi:MAG: hypothetical protein IJ568_03175 [Bacilli bacterium]|nr:hypothetical protein [Bacilli bacterium]
MKSYMKDYINCIDSYIKEKNISDIDEIIETHLVKIKFFMHERLIHLLVTILFAIMTLMTLFVLLNNSSIELMILLVLFVCLLVPYIYHYYYLENSVQYMYREYDELRKLKLKK